MTQDRKQRIISETQSAPAIGSDKGRDEELAAKGMPLGEAMEANKEKKVEGENRPAE